MGNQVSEFWGDDNQLPEAKPAQEQNVRNRSGGPMILPGAPSFSSMMISELPGDHLRDDRAGGSFMLRGNSSFMANDPDWARRGSFAQNAGIGSFMMRGDSMMMQDRALPEHNMGFMYDAGQGSFMVRGDSMMVNADPPRSKAPAPPPKPRDYRPQPGDVVDQHLAAFFRQHPDAYEKHGICRKRQGVYELDGRELRMELKAGGYLDQSGRLFVHDGPLTQPLADYLDMKESSAVYSGSIFEKRGTLESVPKEYRMTFQDMGCNYSSRVDAMKLAKKQAAAREKAAAMYQGGKKGSQDGTPQHGMNMKGQGMPAMATGFAMPSPTTVTRHQRGPRPNIALAR